MNFTECQEYCTLTLKVHLDSDKEVSKLVAFD
eukprot:COSAG05_NODE_4272_length_1588_cov_1.354600_1_plen_31_part_10